LFRASYAGRSSVEEGGIVLAIEVRDNESIDSALRRFKRELHDNGVLEALKRHERYEKPSDKRRRMLAAAIRRSRRAARRRGE
jgi:small subunit ribosomal protein S21